MYAFVKIQLQTQQFHWYIPGDSAFVGEYSGTADEFTAFAKQPKEPWSWVLLMPAADCVKQQLSFSNKEKKHIQKTIPFMLEESLLSDVDDLAIVNSAPVSADVDENTLQVLAVDKTVLSEYLSLINEAGVHPQACIAEQLLLSDFALTPAQLQLLAFDGYCTLQFADKDIEGGRDQVVAQEHLGLALDLLTRGGESLPEACVVRVSESDEASVLAALPDYIQPLVQIERLEPLAVMNQAMQQKKAVAAYNFLKGEFSQGVNLIASIMPWRLAIVSVAVVAIAQLALMLVDIQADKTRFAQQREAMTSLARQVIPRGNIVDPVKQVKQLLAGGEASDASAFMQSFEQIGAVLNTVGVNQMNSIQFDQSTGLFRLDFLVADYDGLQKIISALTEKGLKAEIQNSNAQDDALRARLNVEV